MLLTGPTRCAASVKYRADMKGSKEAPPTDSSGSGKANITYDTKSKKLSWVVTYSRSKWRADCRPFPWTRCAWRECRTRCCISGDIKKGSAELTPDQAADLKAGKWYLNIHTENFPDREIRGRGHQVGGTPVRRLCRVWSQIISGQNRVVSRAAHLGEASTSTASIVLS